MTQDDRIALAEWIMSIRAELTDAAVAQVEREDYAKKSGKPLVVPPLKVKELRLELEVCTEKVAGAKSGAKSGLQFWVLPLITVSGEAELRRQSGLTQKLILTLEPVRPLTLGDGGTELLR